MLLLRAALMHRVVSVGAIMRYLFLCQEIVLRKFAINQQISKFVHVSYVRDNYADIFRDLFPAVMDKQ